MKRDYLPDITVTKVERSRKGWHIYLTFTDFELDSEADYITTKEERLATLVLQNCFRSDSTRSLFDYLRTSRSAQEFNMLFDYKNGRRTKEDKEMGKKLQKIIKNIYKDYAKRSDITAIALASDNNE